MVRSPAGTASHPTPPQAPILTRVGRPLRFVITGATAGGFQLVVMKLLTNHGWHAVAANIAAFLLAAQLNFALSNTFTWGDRLKSRTLRRRWLAFHGSIAGMAVVNLVVFAAARTVLPDLEAAAAGIAAAALGNFLLGEHLVFRASRVVSPAIERAAA